MPISTEQKKLSSQEVEILLNGKKVAFAQECLIKTTRDTKLISSNGEGQAFAVAVGAKQYNLTLLRVATTTEDFDFLTFSDFDVEIKKQGKIHGFLHCEWSEICEHIKSGKSVIQTVAITSPFLNITEV